MGEPKKRGVVQRTLDKVLGVHPDEGKVARDYVPMRKIGKEISQDYARQAIRADYDKALEASVENQRYGRRTFPTALAVGYATPMYRGNQEIDDEVRRKHIAKMQPFYTDPGSGEIDYNQEMLPYVFAANSGMDRMDKATWPAYAIDDPLGDLQPRGTNLKDYIKEKVAKSTWLWDMIKKATNQ